MVLALAPVQGLPSGEVPRHVPTCMACHGTGGVSAMGEVPTLAGQKVAYLERQLKAFRAGTRKDELMQAVALALSDDDIRTLALYWSRVPASNSGAPGADAAAAEALAASRMNMPAGFPEGFTEYWRRVDARHQTMDIAFANRIAWESAALGQQLPDGSVIVVATHDAVRAADGHWTPGPVRSFSGMERQPGWGQAVPALLRNGNWHYGLFTAQGASRLSTQRLGMHHAACLACHQPLAPQSHVFTWPDLSRAARAHRPSAPRE